MQITTNKNIFFLIGEPDKDLTSLLRISIKGYVVLFLGIYEGRFRRDVVLVGFAEGFRSLHFFRE